MGVLCLPRLYEKFICIHGDVKELVPEAVYLALKARREWKKTLLILTALLALTGCGTVVKLIDPSEKYTPYGGAAYDLEMAQKWGLPI